MYSAFGVEHTVSKGVKIKNLMTMRRIAKPPNTGRAAEYSRGKYLKRVYGKSGSSESARALENSTRTTRAQRDANRKGIF